MPEDLVRSETLAVGERKDHVVMLTVVYEEADNAAAVGQVHALPLDRSKRAGTKAKQLLSTNDTLRCLWLSPTNAIWVGSADGNVGTTAAVSWPAPRRGDLIYRAIGKSDKWTATSLPMIKANGLPPSVTALWGTGDSDVHAGTYGGHLFRWDGKDWTQSFDGPGNGEGTIRAFGGNSCSDCFAVGSDNTILHFDGSQWLRVRVPGARGGNIGFTGVHVLADGDVLVSGADDEGILLHGNARGLTEFGRYPIELIDMAGGMGRVLFATGDGVAELFGREVRMIRSTFETATISAGVGRWFFTEPDPDHPSFAEYYPADEIKPWKIYDY